MIGMLLEPMVRGVNDMTWQITVPQVEGINQLRERISKDKVVAEAEEETSIVERLSALEVSVDSAVAGVAHGALAVLMQKYAT